MTNDLSAEDVRPDHEQPLWWVETLGRYPGTGLSSLRNYYRVWVQFRFAGSTYVNCKSVAGEEMFTTNQEFLMYLLRAMDACWTEAWLEAGRKVSGFGR